MDISDHVHVSHTFWPKDVWQPDSEWLASGDASHRTCPQSSDLDGDEKQAVNLDPGDGLCGAVLLMTDRDSQEAVDCDPAKIGAYVTCNRATH